MLPAILDGLAEQAVVVADAVAVGCDLQCRHAFHEAGCKASEAAIAERGVGLHFGELVEIDVEAGKGLAELNGEAEIVQRVHEKTPDQKLQRQVINTPPAFFIVGFLGSDPGLDDPVPGDQRRREEPIPRTCRGLIFARC